MWFMAIENSIMKKSQVYLNFKASIKLSCERLPVIWVYSGCSKFLTLYSQINKGHLI